MAELLTTLAAVKGWLGIENANSDTELMRLIRAGSAYVLNYISRDGFAVREYIEPSFGNGQNTMQLRNYPVISVSALGVAGTLVASSTMGANGLAGTGFVLTPIQGNVQQSINLFGSAFWYKSQVQTTYLAGFQSVETMTIETEMNTDDPPVEVVVPYVTYAGLWVDSPYNTVLIDGVAGVRVLVNDPVPSTGEYYVSDEGVFYFSIADKDKEVVLTYSYVPWDISEAVAQLISEGYRYRQRIGVKSKSLAGQETITYFDSLMTQSIKDVFNLYMNVVPM